MAKKNWAIVETSDGNDPKETEYFEEGMEARLAALQKHWESEHPDDAPYVEFSVVNREGDRLYIGRYEEGVIIRLKDQADHVTFLTNDMFDELLKRLTDPKRQISKR